jgi:glycerophosphoryl diester phosphodiesterase
VSVPAGAVHPAPDWLVDIPLAHRGLHEEGVPENSLPAFAAAAEAGYGVELDVSLSRDGAPVLLHDARLTRVAGDDRRVDTLTAAELAEVRLQGTDVGVPTLPEALGLLTEVPVMVEVKQVRPIAGRIEKVVAEVLDDHDGPFCVAGFNPATLRWFRRRRSRFVRVLTASPLIELPIPRIVLRRLAELRDLPSVEPAAVSYDLDALPSPVTDRWRAAGGALITWTVTDEAGLAKAREVADNHIFEHVRP